MQIHWTGGVGGVVGYHAYGNHYSRAYAQSVHNPNTEGQQEARSKFSFITKLIASLVDSYKVGYAKYAQGMSQRAAFFKALNDDGAITGNMSDGYTVDYEKVFISKGTILPTFAMTASVIGAQHKVSLTWTDNGGQGSALSSDKFNVVLYNVTKKVAACHYAPATRATEAAQIQYSTAWAGDTVYTFVFWQNAETGECSKSQMINFFIAE